MVRKDYRTIFLIEFTKKLVLNSRKEEPVKEIPIVQPAPVQPAQIAPRRIPPKIPPQLPPPQTLIMPQPPKIMPLPLTAEIAPGAQPFPAGFTLGKLDAIISKPDVTSIECTGPEKPILTRNLGLVSTTKLVLNEEEIRKIIKTFSEAARIPLIGGVFKAAVGNLIITAVLSEFVGSRFIINKYAPPRQTPVPRSFLQPPLR